jgi:hypothetical protein
MSGRLYTVEFDALAISAATTDIIELDAAAEKPINVLGWVIGQTTDMGDAQAEGLRYRWVRGNTTSGSGGSTPTPRPCNPTAAAAGFTAETGNTTAASAGTAVNLATVPWTIQAADWVWLPDGCDFGTSGANLLVMRLVAAPTDSVTLSGTVWVLEEG